MNSTKRATGLHLLAIHLSVFFLLVICFSLMPLTVFAQDSVADENAILVAETQKQLEQAREKFLAELATYAENVESFLQRREESVRRTGDLKQVEKAKTERRLFAETGKIPADLPERIKTAPRLARNRLETAYSNAVKNYVRAGLDREAAEVEKELQVFLKFPSGKSASLNSLVGNYSSLPEAKSIDLLSMVNVAEHVIRGSWKKMVTNSTAMPPDLLLMQS